MAKTSAVKESAVKTREVKTSSAKSNATKTSAVKNAGVKSSAVKKTEVQSVRDLNIFPPTHPKVKKLQAKAGYPEIHGDKVWFSSYFIMDWLDANVPAPRSNILEIGCGWGLLGMYCAKNFKAKVLATDADANVFPLLQLHAEANGIKLQTKVSRYEDLKPELLAKQALVLGADICFWDELVEPLHQLIRNALDAGVPRIVIADPGRPPFLRLARRCRKLYKGSLRSVAITKPRKHDGYLLIITNPDVKQDE
jgi:predicted nicotinamide N-methyase